MIAVGACACACGAVRRGAVRARGRRVRVRVRVRCGAVRARGNRLRFGSAWLEYRPNQMTMLNSTRERTWGAEGPAGQLSFASARTRGGARKNAGRKAGPRPKVRHVARGEHPRWRPVHVT